MHPRHRLPRPRQSSYPFPWPRHARALTIALLAACAAVTAACRPRGSAPEPVLIANGTTGDGLHYEISGQGRAVVLVHGTALDLRVWDPQMPALRPRFFVVRYDQRSHGESAMQTRRSRAYEDLGNLLDTLGISSVSLVGLSSGAAVAVDFALAYPRRVEKLVLVAPTVNGYAPTERPAWQGELAQAVRAGDADRAALLFANSPLMTLQDSGSARFVRQIVLENVKLWRDTIGPPQPLEPPAWGRLRELRVPLLVVVGANDVADVRHVADSLTAAVPQAQQVLVPDVGHIVNVAAAGSFNDLLVHFLGQP